MPLRSSVTRLGFMQKAGCIALAGELAAVEPAGAAGLKPLWVAVAPSDGVTSVLYAKRAGLFEKAGLDVTLEIQRNGSAVAAAVLSNAYDIGNSSVTSIFLAHENGLPVTLVAPAGVFDTKSPYAGALVVKDSPLKLDKDANGQTVGVVSLAGIGHDAFCAWVEQHGGDPHSLQFAEIPFSVGPAALEQRRVVATEMTTPVLTSAMDSGNFRLIPIYTAIAPTFILSTWFTSQQYANQNPDTVRTFARVVADAASYVNDHHSETAPAVAEFTGIPLSQVLRMPRSTQGTRLEPALIQPAIDAAVKYGSLKAPFQARDIINAAIAGK